MSLDETGWCKKCANSRALHLTFWTTGTVFTFGLVACSIPLFVYRGIGSDQLMYVGMVIFYGWPVVAIVSFLLYKWLSR